MTARSAFEVAGAILASIGGAGVLLLVSSGWLAKVFANRILEKDRAKFASELERIKAEWDQGARRLQGSIDKSVFEVVRNSRPSFLRYGGSRGVECSIFRRI